MFNYEDVILYCNTSDFFKTAAKISGKGVMSYVFLKSVVKIFALYKNML